MASESHGEEFGRPLSVGVVVGAVDGAVTAWAHRALSGIRDARLVNLAVVVPVSGSTAGAADETASTAVARLRAAAFRLYERADRRAFGRSFDSFALVDLGEELATIETLEVRSEELQDRDAAEPIRNALCRHELDVLVWLALERVPPSFLEIVRFGVWCIRHGDGNRDLGPAPLFWEMYRRDAVAGALLEVRQVGSLQRRVLFQTYSAIDPVSLNRNRNAVYWKLSAAVPRSLARLQQSGRSSIDTHPVSADAVQVDSVETTPSLLQLTLFLGRVGRELVRRQVSSRLYREQWLIAYRARPTRSGSGSRRDFTLLRPPRGRFFADPFLLETNGRHYLFFEDYSFRKQKAIISFVAIDRAGAVTAPRPALERPYHLSYPFVFEWNGTIYMIPETADNRSVELYRAASFPESWKLEATLLKGLRAYDPTLLCFDERLWLFANVPSEGVRIADDLCLFSSGSLLGPWIPHPLNPIVSDVRRARPAGRLFWDGDALIRPGQDSSRGYGHAIVLNRVRVLTQHEYDEEPIDRIGPEWLRGNVGTHTYDRTDSYEVVDGRVRVPRSR